VRQWQQCKRCGDCCKAIPCGVAAAILEVESGQCPALETTNEGQYACGFILHPSHYVDLGEKAEWKDQIFGELIAQVVGIGWGCGNGPAVEQTRLAMARAREQVGKLR
jgi:hypothetical protein